MAYVVEAEIAHDTSLVRWSETVATDDEADAVFRQYIETAAQVRNLTVPRRDVRKALASEFLPIELYIFGITFSIDEKP